MTKEAVEKLEKGFKNLGAEFFERLADQTRYNDVFDLDEIIRKAKAD